VGREFEFPGRAIPLLLYDLRVKELITDRLLFGQRVGRRDALQYTKAAGPPGRPNMILWRLRSGKMGFKRLLLIAACFNLGCDRSAKDRIH